MLPIEHRLYKSAMKIKRFLKSLHSKNSKGKNEILLSHTLDGFSSVSVFYMNLFCNKLLRVLCSKTTISVVYYLFMLVYIMHRYMYIVYLFYVLINPNKFECEKSCLIASRHVLYYCTYIVPI